jgi:alpha-N-arabinofuranosidase
MKKNSLISVFILIMFGLTTTAQDNKITIKIKEAKDTISRHIYGHFSEHLGRCIYGGIWVGEESSIPNINGYRTDVVDALKELQIPNLRWPGGCFADEYHWRDGIGPRENRPRMVNTNWGGVVEDNSFGTHEFLDFCELLGTEPYLSMNVGSGTVEEMAKWVEYVNSDGDSPMANLRRQNGRDKPWNVKFVGVGNESWGCGGEMRPEFYADQFRRYATYCRNYGKNRLYKIASGASDYDFNWTKVLMENIGYRMQGLSLHYYTVKTWTGSKGSATEFNTDEYFFTVKKAMGIEPVVKKHISLMDNYDPENKIGLMVDEWGTWFDVEPGTEPGFLYQQNTLRDALVASINLNVFNNHCHRVKMANIAQIVNVLQAIILTKEDQMVKTPTFYVFKMYKVHKDALLLPVEVNSGYYYNQEDSIPTLSVSASKNAENEVNITLANVNPDDPASTSITIDNDMKYKVSRAEIITAENISDYNDFGKEELVNIKEFKDLDMKGNEVKVNLPPKSVILITLAEK